MPVAHGRSNASRPSKHRAIAARGFGLAERLVGAIDQMLEIGMAVMCCNTNAGRNADALLVGQLRHARLDAVTNLLCNGTRLNVIHLGQQDQKLLATVTKDEITGPNLPDQHARRVLQHPVARVVPEPVIDLLEQFDVEQAHSARRTFAPAELDLALHDRGQEAAVEQLRQHIAAQLEIGQAPNHGSEQSADLLDFARDSLDQRTNITRGGRHLSGKNGFGENCVVYAGNTLSDQGQRPRIVEDQRCLVTPDKLTDLLLDERQRALWCPLEQCIDGFIRLAHYSYFLLLPALKGKARSRHQGRNRRRTKTRRSSSAGMLASMTSARASGTVRE